MVDLNIGKFAWKLLLFVGHNKHATGNSKGKKYKNTKKAKNKVNYFNAREFHTHAMQCFSYAT